MRFDLLIKGGDVVDGAAGYSGKMDVAINRGRIAAVDRDIPREAAFQVIDATGQHVMPGLVDLHTHVFRGVSFWGVDADVVGSRTGVTTWIDAGSAGAFTIEGFREFVADKAAVRILALMNISSIGLVSYDYEVANLEHCPVDLFELMANRNRDLVLGVKVRMGKGTVGANGVEPLERARRAGEACELPVMVHIAVPPPGIEEVIAYLRPGDILTHCFTGLDMKIVDAQGRLLDPVRRAWDSGVIFDVGHGAGSFSFEVAEAVLAAGYRPDVISTDIHQVSMNGPMYDLPTCLTKFLHLGMTLPEVVEAATARPAKALGLEREIGTLRPGAQADVALFTLEPGRYPLYDIQRNVREAQYLLRNTLTLVAGRPLERAALEPPAPWMAWARGGADRPVLEFQRELREKGHVPDQMAATSASTGVSV
jgi:dihydroorotase